MQSQGSVQVNRDVTRFTIQVLPLYCLLDLTLGAVFLTSHCLSMLVLDINIHRNHISLFSFFPLLSDAEDLCKLPYKSQHILQNIELRTQYRNCLQANKHTPDLIGYMKTAFNEKKYIYIIKKIETHTPLHYETWAPPFNTSFSHLIGIITCSNSPGIKGKGQKTVRGEGGGKALKKA